MTNFKELHQKMLNDGYTINPKEQIPINMAKTETFSTLLEQYGDCEATQEYPAAYEVTMPKIAGKRQQSFMVTYNRGK
jgi:hypothetical protein